MLTGWMLVPSTHPKEALSGVAILAGVGTGVYSSVPEACSQMIRVKTTQCVEDAQRYQKNYQLYQGIYQSLKNNFKEAAL